MARSLLWFLKSAAASAVPSDADLLGRWAATRDAAAFELIVRRHAGAVAAVCRRVLRHDADAEDAFQATFLALARHAGSVRAGRSLGGWLLRVALNAARKLRTKRRPSAPLPDVPALPTDFDDSATALHAELARLPKAYQAVLVAVDLEGHSHADAAALLGWPVGTVSGRLVRARAELKRRLIRRGVTAVLAAAAVAVAEASVRAAVAVASGAAVAPPGVLSLSAEVWAMTRSTNRTLAAVVAGGLLATAGAFGLAAVGQGPRPGEPTKPADKKAEPPKQAEAPQNGEPTPEQWRKMQEEREKAFKKIFPDVSDLPKVEPTDSDSAEVKLAKDWLKREVERVALIHQRIFAGSFSGGAVYLQYAETSTELTAAADEASPDPKGHLPWYEFRLKLARGAETFNQPRVEKGVEEPHLLPQLTAARLKAELALLRLKKQIM